MSDKCEVCGEIQSPKHMPCECQMINATWQEISEYIKYNMLKTIVCEFQIYYISKTLSVLMLLLHGYLMLLLKQTHVVSSTTSHTVM